MLDQWITMDDIASFVSDEYHMMQVGVLGVCVIALLLCIALSIVSWRAMLRVRESEEQIADMAAQLDASSREIRKLSVQVEQYAAQGRPSPLIVETQAMHAAAAPQQPLVHDGAISDDDADPMEEAGDEEAVITHQADDRTPHERAGLFESVRRMRERR